MKKMLTLVVLFGCGTVTEPELVVETSNTLDEIGAPCDPATYSGQYQCLPDEDSVSGYAIAN